LDVCEKDSAVMLYDDTTAGIAAAFRTAFGEIGASIRGYNLNELGTRPLQSLPHQILDALEHCTVSIMAVQAVQGEFTLRRAVLENIPSTGRRHVHMPSITADLFIDALSMNYREVASFVTKVAQRMSCARRAVLTSASGTQLEIELSSPPSLEALDGLIVPGTWQNLPSGQVTAHPESVRGVLVVDSSLGDWFQHKYDASKTPVTFEFDGDRVRDVACDNARLLRDLRLFLGSSTHSARVSELAVGANLFLRGQHKASLFDAYREGASLSLGTVVGTTAWASSTAVQLVGKELTLTLDRDPLLVNGRFVI
jgi:hypothetical protein